MLVKKQTTALLGELALPATIVICWQTVCNLSNTDFFMNGIDFRIALYFALFTE